MSEAVAFLYALSQALAAHTLYAPGHPATRRSIENVWDAFATLLAVDPRPVFLFLGADTVYGGRAQNGLRDWNLSVRLAAAGVQRLEFDQSLTLESMASLVELLGARLAGATHDADEPSIPGVVFGIVAVQEQRAPDVPAETTSIEDSGPSLHVNVMDELEMMQYIRTQAAIGIVARAEADAVVRLLVGLVERHALAQASVDGDRTMFRLIHPMNTALLAMAVAHAAGLDDGGRHRIGVAALLHDIGIAQLPASIDREGDLSPADQARFESHTALGARLLLGHPEGGLELAAIVAVEHHLRPDGKGYPARRFEPAPHWASRVTACCSAFAALRAPGGGRPEASLDSALSYLIDGAGTSFDPEIVSLVASVVRSA